MSNLRVPRGVCFTYHRGGDCMGCPFRHDCFKCEGSHRTLNCNFRAKTGGIQSQKPRCKQTSPPIQPPPSPAQQLPTPVNITLIVITRQAPSSAVIYHVHRVNYIEQYTVQRRNINFCEKIRHMAPKTGQSMRNNTTLMQETLSLQNCYSTS